MFVVAKLNSLFHLGMHTFCVLWLKCEEFLISNLLWNGNYLKHPYVFVTCQQQVFITQDHYFIVYGDEFFYFTIIYFKQFFNDKIQKIKRYLILKLYSNQILGTKISLLIVIQPYFIASLSWKYQREVWIRFDLR